jgi:hypothetical protein
MRNTVLAKSAISRPLLPELSDSDLIPMVAIERAPRERLEQLRKDRQPTDKDIASGTLAMPYHERHSRAKLAEQELARRGQRL